MDHGIDETAECRGKLDLMRGIVLSFMAGHLFYAFAFNLLWGTPSTGVRVVAQEFGQPPVVIASFVASVLCLLAIKEDDLLKFAGIGYALFCCVAGWTAFGAKNEFFVFFTFLAPMLGLGVAVTGPNRREKD